MKYYAVFMSVVNKELNDQIRPEHINYLDTLAEKGNIFARGPFEDATGGLVIYTAESFEVANEYALNDPYIIAGARTFDIKEWVVKDEGK